jgi:FtsH-binding integral membrane protein
VNGVLMLAVLIGGFMLVRRAKSFRAGLTIALVVLVLLGLLVSSQP